MKQSASYFFCSRFFMLLTFFVATASFAEPENLTDLKQKLVRYHDVGQYDKDIGGVVNKAKTYLENQVAYYKAHEPEQKLAIVFDIDETCLSNYNHMVRFDFAGQKAQLHEANLKANATAIKDTLSLYQLALKNHVSVFFVTGRRTSELQATKTNLIKAGFHQWAGLYLRSESDKRQSIVPFKSGERAKIEQKGYVILLNIGDQDSDLQGGHAKHMFKLPNPFYKLP